MVIEISGKKYYIIIKQTLDGRQAFITDNLIIIEDIGCQKHNLLLALETIKYAITKTISGVSPFIKT